jgi:hypothetical protein
MEAPRRYSVSPWYSFVTVPVQRSPSFSEIVSAIWKWWREPTPTPTLRERQLEAALIERLAEETDADKEASHHE